MRGGSATDEIKHRFPVTLGDVRITRVFSTANLFESFDIDSEAGCIRPVECAYTENGGLVVLYGNIVANGVITESAGIDRSLSHLIGKAFVTEPQGEAVEAILNKQIEESDVVVIQYEGPKGGLGTQEMPCLISCLKGLGLDKRCVLIIDGRFPDGTSGTSTGCISPEVAASGAVGLV